MGARAWIPAVGVLVVACHPGSVRVALAPPRPLPEPTLLWTRHALGQGCPIAPRVLVTPRHVLRLREDVLVDDATWAQRGREGRARLVWADPGRDLAVLVTDTPLPRWYAVASTAPAPGAPLWVVVYDPSTRFVARLARAAAYRALGGHLILEAIGVPGYSGACVLDSDGRAVAVYQWQLRGAEPSAVASGLWGPWAPPIPKEEA